MLLYFYFTIVILLFLLLYCHCKLCGISNVLYIAALPLEYYILLYGYCCIAFTVLFFHNSLINTECVFRQLQYCAKRRRQFLDLKKRNPNLKSSWFLFLSTKRLFCSRSFCASSPWISIYIRKTADKLHKKNMWRYQVFVLFFSFTQRKYEQCTKVLLQALAPSWRLPPLPTRGGRKNLLNFWIFAVGFVVFYFPWRQRSEFQNN